MFHFLVIVLLIVIAWAYLSQRNTVELPQQSIGNAYCHDIIQLVLTSSDTQKFVNLKKKYIVLHREFSKNLLDLEQQLKVSTNNDIQIRHDMLKNNISQLKFAIHWLTQEIVNLEIKQQSKLVKI
jgi:hypothetical protein